MSPMKWVSMAIVILIGLSLIGYEVMFSKSGTDAMSKEMKRQGVHIADSKMADFKIFDGNGVKEISGSDILQGMDRLQSYKGLSFYFNLSGTTACYPMGDSEKCTNIDFSLGELRSGEIIGTRKTLFTNTSSTYFIDMRKQYKTSLVRNGEKIVGILIKG